MAAVLKTAFNKLVVKFAWRANRKDRFGKEFFEGGFLGSGGIGMFAGRAPLRTASIFKFRASMFGGMHPQGRSLGLGSGFVNLLFIGDV
jgi:hypothetical protein